MTLHTVPGRDPRHREMHVIHSNATPGGHHGSEVLASFRGYLQQTMEARLLSLCKLAHIMIY
jgi:hypothetical protein